MSSAEEGTAMSSRMKYLTSRSSFSSTRSKFTLSMRPSRTRSGWCSFACEAESMSRPHSSTFCPSYSASEAESPPYSFISSLDSERSRICCASSRSLLMGWSTRCRSPRPQNNAATTRGMF